MIRRTAILAAAVVLAGVVNSDATPASKNSSTTTLRLPMVLRKFVENRKRDTSSSQHSGTDHGSSFGAKTSGLRGVDLMTKRRAAAAGKSYPSRVQHFIEEQFWYRANGDEQTLDAGRKRSIQLAEQLDALRVFNEGNGEKPTRASIEESVASFTGRKLEANSPYCGPQVLNINMPTPYWEISVCVAEKMADSSVDWSIPGAETKIHYDCWCDLGMTAKFQDLYAEYGMQVDCCQHAEWEGFCQVECGSDVNCDDALATQCISQCPPLCMEPMYSAGITCDCDDCMSKLSCLVDNAHHVVSSGSHDRVCDLYTLDNSQEFKDFLSCQWKHAHRTRWDQLSANAHCICEPSPNTGLSLQQKTADTHCDDVPGWGEDIAALGCSARATTCADTSSGSELTACEEECGNKCAHMNEVSQDCEDHCFADDGKCRKYAVCEPPAHEGFGYVCDDGSAPEIDGCCKGGSTFLTSTGGGGGRLIDSNGDYWGCPMYCESMNLLYAETTSVYECGCSSCPATYDDIKAKFEDMAREVYNAEGSQVCSEACSKYKLPTSTTEMDAFNAERTTKLLDAITYVPGQPTPSETSEILEIKREFRTKIFTAAAWERKRLDLANGVPIFDPPAAAVIVEASLKWLMALPSLTRDAIVNGVGGSSGVNAVPAFTNMCKTAIAASLPSFVEENDIQITRVLVEPSRRMLGDDNDNLENHRDRSLSVVNAGMFVEYAVHLTNQSNAVSAHSNINSSNFASYIVDSMKAAIEASPTLDATLYVISASSATSAGSLSTLDDYDNHNGNNNNGPTLTFPGDDNGGTFTVYTIEGDANEMSTKQKHLLFAIACLGTAFLVMCCCHCKRKRDERIEFDKNRELFEQQLREELGEDTVVGRPLGTFAQRKKRAADGHVKEDFGNSEEFWVEGDAAPEVALGKGTGSASSTSVGVPAAGSRVFFDDNNNNLQTEDAKNVPMGRPVLPDVGRAPGFAGSAFGVDNIMPEPDSKGGTRPPSFVAGMDPATQRDLSTSSRSSKGDGKSRLSKGDGKGKNNSRSSKGDGSDRSSRVLALAERIKGKGKGKDSSTGEESSKGKGKGKNAADVPLAAANNGNTAPGTSPSDDPDRPIDFIDDISLD